MRAAAYELAARLTNLYKQIKGREHTSDTDDSLRRAISGCVALGSAHGWRITKEKPGDKIDVTVARAGGSPSGGEEVM